MTSRTSFSNFTETGRPLMRRLGRINTDGKSLGQQRLAIDVDAGSQAIVLRLVLEEIEAGEIALADDDRLPAPASC